MAYLLSAGHIGGDQTCRQEAGKSIQTVHFECQHATGFICVAACRTNLLLWASQECNSS